MVFFQNGKNHISFVGGLMGQDKMIMQQYNGFGLPHLTMIYHK